MSNHLPDSPICLYDAVDEMLDAQQEVGGGVRCLVRKAGIAFIVFGCALLMCSAAFEIEVVKGVSMEPTLPDGTVTISTTVSFLQQPAVGDILILTDTGEADYVKRVVAAPGDNVDIDDSAGVLIVNGHPLAEPYVQGKTYSISNGISFPMTLKADEYLLLGDNREQSYDSRSWGPVSKSRIKARVLFPCD